MTKKSPDLHGNVPDSSRVALLLIDLINDLDFVGGDQLLRHALPAAKKIAALKGRAKLAGIPSIYVNDNFGKWRSDLKSLISHCLDGARGQPVVSVSPPALLTNLANGAPKFSSPHRLVIIRRRSRTE